MGLSFRCQDFHSAFLFTSQKSRAGSVHILEPFAPVTGGKKRETAVSHAGSGCGERELRRELGSDVFPPPAPSYTPLARQVSSRGVPSNLYLFPPLGTCQPPASSRRKIERDAVLSGSRLRVSWPLRTSLFSSLASLRLPRGLASRTLSALESRACPPSLCFSPTLDREGMERGGRIARSPRFLPAWMGARLVAILAEERLSPTPATVCFCSHRPLFPRNTPAEEAVK